MNFTKRIKTFLLILLILPLCLCFSACSPKETIISAYEIAVKNGFKGTESEWLESLKGKSAYELAVENGFKGTESEWLESLKGEKSAMSAYEIAVKYGFKGTEKEWLESLQGKNGNDGKDGKNVDTYEMFETAKEKGQIPDNYSYLDFIREYFAISGTVYSSATASKNMMSVVTVESYMAKNASSSSNSGSGVIISMDSDGNAYVVTNYHVVYNSRSNFYPYYKLFLVGQETAIPATFVGSSRDYDLAVLKVTASEIASGETKTAGEILKSSNATTASFREEGVSLGETIYAIGNTSSAGITLTRGIVSVESEIIKMTIGGRTGYYREIRHDAYIYHGNSGGGLFDENGNLIGITNGGVDNTLMNYAIPIDVVKPITEKLIESYENGETTPQIAKLGIENFCEYYSEDNLKSENVITIYNSETGKIETRENVVISKIDNSELAEKLKSGDIIKSIEVNGKLYENIRVHTLKVLLISAKVGDTFVLNIERVNEDNSILPFSVSVTLTSFDFVDMV